MPNIETTTSGKKESCDLCGLVVEANSNYCLNSADENLIFCCDACLGIYKLLNEVDQEEGLQSFKD